MLTFHLDSRVLLALSGSSLDRCIRTKVMTTHWIVALASAGVYWRFWKIIGKRVVQNPRQTVTLNIYCTGYGMEAIVGLGRIVQRIDSCFLLGRRSCQYPARQPCHRWHYPTSSGSHKASGCGLWGRHFYSSLVPFKSNQRCLSYHAARADNAVSTVNGK